MSKPKYLPVPPYESARGGCKVGWLYFKTEDEAKAAAKIAEHNANVLWDEGYDFGFQSPGSIKFVENYVGENAKYNGLWEVCFP